MCPALRLSSCSRIKSVILNAEFECLGLNYYEKALKRRERTQQREMELWNTSLIMVSTDNTTPCDFPENIYCLSESIEIFIVIHEANMCNDTG